MRRATRGARAGFEWENPSPPPTHNFDVFHDFDRSPHDYYELAARPTRPRSEESPCAWLTHYHLCASRVAPGAEPTRGPPISARSRKQKHAATLGMWVFLGTEVLLFGGLFVGYAYYRSVYPAIFGQRSAHLSMIYGTVNTLILHREQLRGRSAPRYFVHHGRIDWPPASCAFAIACGFAFLGLKRSSGPITSEKERIPAQFYAFAAVRGPAPASFSALLSDDRAARGSRHGWYRRARVGRGAPRSRSFSPAYDTPLELVTMYWHLVDIVWILPSSRALYVI